MKRKLPVLNFALGLTLFLLLRWGVQSWFQPKFPSTVKGDEIIPAPRELKIPTLSRQPYSNIQMGDVSRLNLFRKQRKKYYRPKPPKPKPMAKPAPFQVSVAPPPPPSPPKPTAPPPQLVLTGVMLLGNQKVVIFEGTYSEIRGGQLVQNLKPRRRGYKIGETLGDYRIQTIDKSHATLSAITGNNITLTISKTSPTEKIQKSGNTLVQKGRPASNKIPATFPTRRTHRSQPPPLQKNPSGKPPINLAPLIPAPGTKTSAPNPLNLDRLQKLKQKSMGIQ